MSIMNYYRNNRSKLFHFSDEDILIIKELSEFIDANKQDIDSIESAVGYSVIGPMLFGYTAWLHKQAMEENADRILFLSREGKILQRAYKMLYGNSSMVSCEYVNVSRLALSKATMSEINSYEELYASYAWLFRGITRIDEFFKLLEIEVDDTIYRRYNLCRDFYIDDIMEKSVIYEILVECGKNSLLQQADYAKEYLGLRGLAKGTTIISDLGWSGTMQALISTLFPKGRFIGCYFATSNINRAIDANRIDRRGFWFEGDNDNRWNLVRFIRTVFEYLFINNEGTTTGYTYSNGEVIPQKTEVATDTKIENAHEMALKFIYDIERIFNSDIENINRNIWFVPLVNFAVYPNRETAVFLNNVSFTNGAINMGFLPKHNFIFYIIHPKAVFDELQLNNSKIIWLYGLMHLPIPYYSILCFVTDMLTNNKKHL